MNSILRRFLPATLLLLAITFGPQAAQAQVTQQIPAEAVMVIRVKNLQDVSGKISSLATKWGMAEMSPDLADPLGAMQRELKIENGLNKEGDAAFVFIDVPEGGKPEESMIVLMPVSDFAAFTANFPDAKVDGDVTSFTMPENGETGYVAQWGNYAAVAPRRELVATKPQEALKVEGLAQQELEGKDLILYANFKQLGPKLLPELAEARTQMMTDLEREMEANEQVQNFAPVARAFANQMMNIAQEFCQDAQAATFGMNMSEEGIATTMMAEFTPDSHLGQTAQSIKNTDATLVEGLPDTKYLFFGGMSADPAVVTKIFDDFAGPVVQELQNGDLKAMAEYVEAMKQYMGAQRAQSFGMLAPSGALGAESLVQFVAVAEGDSKALIEAYQRSFNSQAELMKEMMKLAPQAGADDDAGVEGQADEMADDAGQADAADAAEEPVQLTYTPAAKTVAGVTFDQFSTAFNIDPQTPEDAQAAQMLALIYGPEGMNGFVGAVDDQHVLFVTGGDDELLTRAVASVKANETKVAQAAHVQQVAKQLPLNRVAAMYFPLGQWIETGVAYAQQFGLAVPFEVPENLPPIGMTVGTDQSAVRVDGFVPSALVENLVSIGMQMYMGMQGGQPGGPGGM